MPGGGVEIKVEGKERINALAKLMRAQADGKALRVELIAGLRAAAQPSQDKVKGQLRGFPHGGVTQGSPALGSYLASRTRTQVRLSGRRTGVAVRIPLTPGIRGFRKAAQALNSEKGWRHPVFGKGWVNQVSPLPGFFDKTMSEARGAARAAVLLAVKSMERRLSRRW